jgi:hypothetical protein
VGIADLVVARPGEEPGGLLGLAVDRRLDDEESAALRGLAGVADAWAVELA